MVIRSLLVAVLSLATPATVWAAECGAFTPSGDASPGSPEFAAELGQLAGEASEADCLEQADRLYEGAYRVEPKPRYLYERILVRERMEDYEFAFELLDGYRSELVSDPSLTDLVQVEARLRAGLRSTKKDPDLIEEPKAQPAKRSTLDTVGPIVLGTLGVASLGFAVYGMTAKCDQTASDGTCLSGSEVAVGPTAAYGVGGVLGLVGAAVWWIVGIRKTPAESVHLTPQGIAVSF